ncbi:MAG: hypothetical protein JWM34_767 [Ilumatobacteraceae bacterium]|nr:hypothetical protein [Ilumatobacteraceae bacterium]
MSARASTAQMPFSAVVGADDAKLALLLAAKNPLIGGVLLRGDKGSAKTTLARSLASLLPGDAPFVELPLGATEDRVIGSVDLASMLRDGNPVVRDGLLAAAHGGVLYVDEINLLADHLIDSLLDVAVSGVNRIERDGITHEHPARFVLIGSMNPEEGELRPQLLDRFGFSVDVRASTVPAERALAVRRRMAFDRGDASMSEFDDADDDLRNRLAGDVTAELPDELVEAASVIAVAVGAEGLRADLMLCRGAAAHAAWHDRAVATEDDLRAVAPFVLAHRRRRSPLEPPGISQPELDDAFDEAFGPDDPSDADSLEQPEPPTDADQPSSASSPRPPVDPSAAATPPTLLTAPAATPTVGRRAPAPSDRGRFVRAERTDGPVSAADVAVTASAIAVAARRAANPDASPEGTAVEADDLRVAVRSARTGNLVVLCVDASGSMGAVQRMSLAKGAVLGLLTDAYQRRDRIALITFAGDGADIVLRPTASVEIAQARLRELPTGGTSPIAAGLDAVHQLVAGSSGDSGLSPLVVLITDGRATGGVDALDRSRASARRLAEQRIPVVVIDAESGPTRLGLAVELAEVMSAPCLPLDGLVDGSLERTIRLQLR